MARPKKEEVVYLIELNAEGVETGKFGSLPFAEALEILEKNALLPAAEQQKFAVARKFEITFEREVKVKPKY